MIGRLHHLIIDCPDPLALARFYAELLAPLGRGGWPVTWAVTTARSGSVI